MHKLNELRLLAGIQIDPEKEKTVKPITEARKVPANRRGLAKKSKRNMESRVHNIKCALEHLEKAYKALADVPATDYMGDIPTIMDKLDGVLDDDGEGGINDLVDHFERELSVWSRQNKAKSEKGKSDRAKVKAEEEEAGQSLADTMASLNSDDELEGGDEELGDELGDEVPLDGEEFPDDELEGGDELGDEVPSEMSPEEMIAKLSGEELGDEELGDEELGDEELGDEELGDEEFPDDELGDEEIIMIGKKKKNSVTEAGGITLGIVGFEDNEDDDKDEGPVQLKSLEEPSDQDQTENDLEGKVKVPAGIKQALKTEIDQAKKKAEKLNVSNRDAAQFYSVLANAFEDLLGHIEGGTVYDMKQAQIFMSSLMGPILHKIPAKVIKFVVHCGQPRSLLSHMKDVSKEYPKVGPQDVLK